MRINITQSIGLAIILTAALAGPAAAQDNQPATETASADQRRTLFDQVRAGGVVGFVLIGLSIAGCALVVDGMLRLKVEKLVPPPIVEQALASAQRGRFAELLSMCKTHDSMYARIVAAALAQGQWGVDAVREGLQQSGEREITLLRQRIGYIGFLAAIAPMLGLLGTVVGMINSFGVLGESKGAASPEELAVGIAVALVTTCMGLVIAVPLMFFHAYLRDRVTRIGLAAAAECEKLVRVMAFIVDQRQRERPAASAAAAAPASAPTAPPQPAPAPPASQTPVISQT